MPGRYHLPVSKYGGLQSMNIETVSLISLMYKKRADFHYCIGGVEDVRGQDVKLGMGVKQHSSGVKHFLKGANPFPLTEDPPINLKHLEEVELIKTQEYK